VTVEADAPAWERLPGELGRAYAVFRSYRDLPVADRRLETVAEQAGVSPRQVRAWAARWDWRERADAWDDEVHRIDDRERLEAIRTMHANHRRAGRAALLKALQALQHLDPAAMPAGSVARLLELGARLERDTLLVSVEKLQGVEVDGEASEDPWERIARELDPATAG
jgi:hypothetical protein